MQNKFEVGQKVRYMNENYPLLNGRIFEVESYLFNGVANTTKYKLKHIGHDVDENNLYHTNDVCSFKVGDILVNINTHLLVKIVRISQTTNSISVAKKEKNVWAKEPNISSITNISDYELYFSPRQDKIQTDFKVGDRVKIKGPGKIYSNYFSLAKEMGIKFLYPASRLSDQHGVIIDIKEHLSDKNKVCVGVHTDDNKYFIIEQNGLEELDTKLYVEPYYKQYLYSIDKSDFNLSQNNTMENLKDLRFENFASKNKKKIISISEELIEKQKLFDEMKKFFMDLECDISSLGSRLDSGYSQRDKEYITDVLKEAKDKLAEVNTKEYIELVKLFNSIK